MKVERKDLYDFEVILTSRDFEALKSLADKLNMPIELVLAGIISCGMESLTEMFIRKE